LHWGSYRSAIGINIKGDADSQNTNPGFAELRVFADTGASANMDLAGSLSALYLLTDSRSLLGDATQTDWAQSVMWISISIVPTSPVRSPLTPGTVATVIPLVCAISICELDLSPRVDYDETPVADEMHRTSCLSDDNRR
jgi:hypothetical protein